MSADDDLNVEGTLAFDLGPYLDEDGRIRFTTKQAREFAAVLVASADRLDADLVGLREALNAAGGEAA